MIRLPTVCLAFSAGLAVGIVVPIWLIVAALRFAKQLEGRSWEA